MAVLRAYNPNALAGSHVFTASAGEHSMLADLGWSDEGVAWYGAGA